MSDKTSPSYKRVDGTPLIEKLELLDGVSAKTGNPYLLPTLYLKSPISDTPIRLEFKFIDPNVTELIRLKLKELHAADVKDFKEDVDQG